MCPIPSGQNRGSTPQATSSSRHSFHWSIIIVLQPLCFILEWACGGHAILIKYRKHWMPQWVHWNYSFHLHVAVLPCWLFLESYSCCSCLLCLPGDNSAKITCLYYVHMYMFNAAKDEEEESALAVGYSIIYRHFT